MKLILGLFFIFLSSTCFGKIYLDEEEYPISKYQSKVFDKTRDALLSVDYIEERADYFVFKLKNLTFGEYAEDVMYVAPLFTGRFEVRAFNFNLYYNTFQEKGGLKYKVSF